MSDVVIVHGLQYASYGLELCLVVILAASAAWKKLPEFFWYVIGFFAVDAVMRPLVLVHFGARSFEYRYFYWVSDAALTIGVFLLIGFFFRRAFASNRENWLFVRRMLAVVFAFVVLATCFVISLHFDHLFTRFLVEFQQNLYFASLVLITLLYLALQHTEGFDERIEILVCGLGIEFAGPAATLALMYLTPGGRFGGFLLSIVMPICTLGMLSTWIYAVKCLPEKTKAFAPKRRGRSRVAPLTEVSVRGVR